MSGEVIVDQVCLVHTQCWYTEGDEFFKAVNTRDVTPRFNKATTFERVLNGVDARRAARRVPEL